MANPLARTQENLAAPPAVNSLFAALELEFHEVFYDPGTAALNFSSELYVSQRTLELAPEQIEALCSRLPSDVREYFSNKVIGSYELDFLDFVLNYKNNKVLSILGTSGVGKTTFLKHICFHLQDQLPSLQFCRFIYVDLLGLDNERPTHRDYAQLLMDAATGALTEIVPVDMLRTLDQLLRRSGTGSNDIGITDIHRLVRNIRVLANRELVIIFDNIDQLKPETVVAVSALARAIFVATDQAVVVSLRPPSESIRAELSKGKATFFPYLISLPPPDLYNIVWRRMGAILTKNRIKMMRDQVVIDMHGFAIKISNVSERIEILLGNVLLDTLQNLVLQKLCNNNVRAALRTFESYIKHKELSFNLIFDFKAKEYFPYKNQRRVIPRLNHFLYGAMVGDRQLYSEEAKGSNIVNLFEFRTPERAEVDHILLYLLLCVFYSYGNHIKISKVLNWMSQFGYIPQVANRAISHLIWKGLLTSPEGDGPDGGAENAKISTTGQYYVETLCMHETYLLNIVFDTELRTRSPEFSEARFFRHRVIALANLIELVALQEQIFLQRLFEMETPEASRMFEAIQNCGTLSEKLFRTFNHLNLRTRHRELDRGGDQGQAEFQRHMGELMQALSDQIARPVRRVSSLINKRKTRNHEISRENEVKEARLEGLGHVQMVHPKKVVAGRGNAVELSFVPFFPISNNELIASWRGTSLNNYFREYVLMTRNESATSFKGKFSVQLDEGVTSFPSNSEITFFDEAKDLGAVKLAAS